MNKPASIKRQSLPLPQVVEHNLGRCRNQFQDKLMSMIESDCNSGQAWAGSNKVKPQANGSHIPFTFA
jgi:hypothetical protein